LYGYNLITQDIDWDFYVGSDIDGSPVVTADSCIIFTIEKQYIDGHGGAFKVDPGKSPEESVVWFFPVNDHEFNSWEGGIIGSACVNDSYARPEQTKLAAFSAIDGYLYVVDHTKVFDSLVDGPLLQNQYPTPVLVYNYKTGPSISTPIMVNNKLSSDQFQ